MLSVALCISYLTDTDLFLTVRTKRDRADQFSRRMHKEAPMTKA